MDEYSRIREKRSTRLVLGLAGLFYLTNSADVLVVLVNGLGYLVFAREGHFSNWMIVRKWLVGFWNERL